MLKENYTLFLVDLPGFGQTQHMEWQDFSTALLQQLPHQFAVVGWSLGGLYAMRLALEASARVTHLVVVASTPCFLQDQDWPGIEKTVLDGFSTNLQQNKAQLIADFVNLQLRNNTAIVVEPCINNFAGLQYGLHCLATWNLKQALLKSHVTGCFIFGRLDAIVPIKTMQVMQRDYSHFQYHVIKKAGHLPFLSHPNEFIEILRGFL